MVIINKSQVEIGIKDYKLNDRIKIVLPDEAWTKHHFIKAEYNLRMARINFNLDTRKDLIKELEKSKEMDDEFSTSEWVIIMAYYAMFHAVQALLRKIGIKIGKEYAHEITSNLLLHYFYYTRIIEDELLTIYERAEEQARKLVVSYIFAKEKRTHYQYSASTESAETEAGRILEDAAIFVSRLAEIEKTLSKELVMARLGKKSL